MKKIIFILTLVMFLTSSCASIMYDEGNKIRLKSKQQDLNIVVFEADLDIITRDTASGGDYIDEIDSNSDSILIYADKDGYRGKSVPVTNSIRYGSFCLGNIPFLGMGHLIDIWLKNYRGLDKSEVEINLEKAKNKKLD